MGPHYQGSVTERSIYDSDMEGGYASKVDSPCPSMEEEAIERISSAVSAFDFNEDSEEGRLSRALQTWMPDHEFSELSPLEKPPFELVYSGRLGGNKYLKNASSEESIVTKLSLFSCSSGGSEKTDEDQEKPKKKRGSSSSKSTRAQLAEAEREAEIYRKWEELSRRKLGEFTSLMKNRNALAMTTYTGLIDEENELYKLISEEDRKYMMMVGRTKGLHLTSDLKKSGSMTNIREEFSKFPVKTLRARVGSAGSKPRGKLINLEEIRQQRLNAKLAQMERHSRLRGHRKALSKRLSIASDISSAFEPDTPSIRSLSPEPEPEERISVWKGDREILEMDLRKGLTAKASKKIKSTTAALERVTGFGDPNTVPVKYGRNDEFPFHAEKDYGMYPKIVHKIRVSPQLSDVIKTDIKIRMGRPRYHEIRKKDIDVWTRGQKLDRGHRNLKVFNWLHSLKEDEFDKDIEMEIRDTIPDDTKLKQMGILHVEAADEPDAMPLYMKKFKLG